MPRVNKPAARKPAKRPATGTPSILLVEDDRFLAGMYVTKLELEGFRVLLARDGEEGWNTAREHHPALVLLDLVLPKLSGFQVLEKIRKDADLAKTPVILLTNLGQRQDVERGMELGADDYLVKVHFLPSEVIDKVKKLLASHA